LLSAQTHLGIEVEQFCALNSSIGSCYSGCFAFLCPMLEYKVFELGPFAENTYVFWLSDTRQAWVIDPGCYDLREKHQLKDFIQAENLKPVRLLNTHCHLDHIFGNRFIYDTYSLSPECHSDELLLLERMPSVAAMYGIGGVEPSPPPKNFLQDKEELSLGEYVFECILAPGHSPGSICFYCAKEQLLIGGDVLFLESIGRTDLPGGNHNQLIKSIRERIFTLPEQTIVLPGHGPETSIRHEKVYNPFL
jgi:glyoxylase-like metal-dependent hydrolase (beta-lactamase superfamily II)